MHIGIITLSRIRMNQGAFYNLQDVGLAKAFARAGHRVTLYRLTEDGNKTEESGGVTMIFIKTPGVGRQAVTGFSFLDKSVERLICFSDNQVSFPALYRWCEKENIMLLPYIGVLRSNSPHKLIAFATNLLSGRNIRIYRKMKVYVKTPFMREQLIKKGVMRVQIIPVCLDTELLHQEKKGRDAESESLKIQWGYDKEDKILLFIGRMEPEKEPLEMISIFKSVHQKEPHYKLLMIGQGNLLTKAQELIRAQGLTECVKIIPHILNQDIWEAFRISDCFVNLNRHEIYGMSILEALYYKCPVAAMRAPGPQYILQDICPEALCDTMQQVIQCVTGYAEKKEPVALDKQKSWIIEKYSWDYYIQLLLSEQERAL